MDNINSKIEEIDKLLNDTSLLSSYIEDIENINIELPPDLEDSLINRFNNSKNINKNVFLENSIKIFKIAACTIFALVIWNVSLSKPIVTEETDKDTSVQIQSNIDNTFKSVSEFLLTPIKIERNDK